MDANVIAIIAILVDVGLFVIGGLMGLVIRAQNEKIENLQEKVDNLPETYARRDDVREMKQDILKAIENLSLQVQTVMKFHG